HDQDGAPLPAMIARSYDALATGAGLDLAARAALARRRRDAFGIGREPGDALARDFRADKPRLRRWLAHPPPPFVPYATTVARALTDLPISRRESLLAPLLHLAAVRLAGPDRDAEAEAIYLWERTLESLLRHAER